MYVVMCVAQRRRPLVGSSLKLFLPDWRTTPEMRQKQFIARKKHHKRRKRAKLKVKLYEQGQLKYKELPRLARELLARKRRQAARSAG